jgi:hypothetical protein
VRDGVGEGGAVSDVRRVGREYVLQRVRDIDYLNIYIYIVRQLIILYHSTGNIRLIISAELRDTVNTLHPHSDRVLHHQPPRLSLISLSLIPCACGRVSHGGVTV